MSVKLILYFYWRTGKIELSVNSCMWVSKSKEHCWHIFLSIKSLNLDDASKYYNLCIINWWFIYILLYSKRIYHIMHCISSALVSG